jgi:hypothetical protein
MYNSYYGTSNTFPEILKRELCDPVGSNFTFVTNLTQDQINNNVQAAFRVDSFGPYVTTPLGVIQAPNIQYIPSAHPHEPTKGIDITSNGTADLVTGTASYFRKGWEYSQTVAAANRYVFGNGGGCGTIGDVNKLFRILARKGLDPNGNVLISEREIAGLICPSVTSEEYSGTQKYYSSTLGIIYSSYGSTWAKAGIVMGPGLQTATTNEPSIQLVNAPLGREIRNLTGVFPSTFGSIPYVSPFNCLVWAGTTGCWHMISTEEQAVLTVSTQAGTTEFTDMIFDGCLRYVTNDIMLPNSNNTIYTTSGRAVPFIPEPPGGNI